MLLLLLAAAPGCGGASAPALMDGASASPPPSALADTVEDAVLTRVRIVRLGGPFPADISTCVAAFRPARPASGSLGVDRVGVAGRSLTFALAGKRFACDAIAKPRADPDLARLRPWCGLAVGRTRAGRLIDARLAFCSGDDGTTTAFAWIEPLPDAKWIVVRDGSRREIYAVAGSLPVRVATTSDVFLEESRALFHVAQYAGDGRLLRESTLDAAVAG